MNRSLLMSKGCEEIVFPVNAHQKVPSAEEDFSNQVGRITHSEDSQTFSPAIPVAALEAMSKLTIVVEDRSYAWAQKHILPLVKVEKATASAMCQIHQQQRPMLSFRYGTITWCAQSTSWWQVDYIGRLPLW